jgi:probable HAF family extracellular repeat protein
MDSSGVSHGFLYSNGHYTTIDDPLGTEGTFASAINDKGQIVGEYVDSNGAYHGFLYNKGYYGQRDYTTLDDPLASGAQGGTSAYGINDKGQIVGGYVDSSGGSHGFLYSNGNGHYTTTSIPPVP